MKKILIIDHDPEIRNSTAEVLQMANYKVIIAGNGKTGIDLAVKHKPDLIICGIMMPEMNGYEVLYFIRQNPLIANTPFVFLTSKKDISDIRKGMNMGADDYLFKPVEKMELLTCIEARLRRRDRSLKISRNIEGLNEFLNSADGSEKLKKLLAGRNVRKVAKKEMIYREGEVAFYVLFVIKGKVKTYFNNEAGKEFITGLIQPGEFAGIVDLLTSEMYRESAMAAENGEIILIPKNEFFSLFISNHDVALRIIHLISKNTLELRERLFHIAYNSVRKRTANALLSFLKIADKGNLNDSLSISRDDLAAVIGITPESVSRTLHDFKEEKLITFKSKSSNIVILNKDDLAEMKN
jgi:DNA-binding response OmpR family regulator